MEVLFFAIVFIFLFVPSAIVFYGAIGKNDFEPFARAMGVIISAFGLFIAVWCFWQVGAILGVVA